MIGQSDLARVDDDRYSNILIQVRPYNLRKLYQIRDLEPTHIDKLVTIKGIVIRNGDVIPEMKQACFKCYRCQNTQSVFIDRARITEPDTCNLCQAKQSF
jgi:DNA replication licensing factor MCM4